MTRPLAVQAARAIALETDRRLPARWRFVIRHRRWLPTFLWRKALRAYADARMDAERALPRRYRRALRGERMVPAK